MRDGVGPKIDIDDAEPVGDQTGLEHVTEKSRAASDEDGLHG